MKLPKLGADYSPFSEDILAFTETCVNPDILDSEVLSNNFSTYRTDRSPRRRSGVLIAVTSTLTSLVLKFLCNLFLFFIPPGSDLIIYEHHLSAIKTVLSHLSDRDLLIVFGDFNLPGVSWSLPLTHLSVRIIIIAS